MVQPHLLRVFALGLGLKACYVLQQSGTHRSKFSQTDGRHMFRYPGHESVKARDALENLVFIIHNPVGISYRNLILDPNRSARPLTLLQTHLLPPVFPRPHRLPPRRRYLPAVLRRPVFRPRNDIPPAHNVVKPQERALAVFVSAPLAPPRPQARTAVFRRVGAFGVGAGAEGTARAPGDDEDERTETGQAGADDAHGWLGVGSDGCVDEVP